MLDPSGIDASFVSGDHRGCLRCSSSSSYWSALRMSRVTVDLWTPISRAIRAFTP